MAPSSIPDVEALTASLVEIDSVSHHSTGQVASLVRDALVSLGASVHLQSVPRGEVMQVNVLGKLGEGRGGLLLAGHLDTVPFVPGQKAVNRAVREGDDLFGRGTCDMKGGIAAQLVAAARASSRGSLGKPVWFGFTFEEEVGMTGARMARDLRYLDAEQAIVAEPTCLVPVTMHKGYFSARIHMTGKAGHSSEPESALSAVEGAGLLLSRLYGLRDQLRAEVVPSSPLHPPYATLNVGCIHGGTATNVVAEECWLTVEIRPLPGQDPSRLSRRVLEAMEEVERALPGLVLRLEPGHDLPPFHTQEDSPLAAWLEENTGTPCGTVAFATEAPLFSGPGTTVVVCGPGSISHAHREDERVSIEALHRAVDLYEGAIDAFCR